MPKKRNFLVKFFEKKVPKNAFFGLFLSKWLRRRKFIQNRVLILICESSENQFGRPKKRVDKFFDFIKNPPLLEKILNPPLAIMLKPIYGYYKKSSEKTGSGGGDASIPERASNQKNPLLIT